MPLTSKEEGYRDTPERDATWAPAGRSTTGCLALIGSSELISGAVSFHLGELALLWSTEHSNTQRILGNVCKCVIGQNKCITQPTRVGITGGRNNPISTNTHRRSGYDSSDRGTTEEAVGGAHLYPFQLGALSWKSVILKDTGSDQASMSLLYITRFTSSCPRLLPCPIQHTQWIGKRWINDCD